MCTSFLPKEITSKDMGVSITGATPIVISSILDWNFQKTNHPATLGVSPMETPISASSKSGLQATSGLEIQTRDHGLRREMLKLLKKCHRNPTAAGLSVFQVLVIDDLVNSLATTVWMNFKAWWGHYVTMTCIHTQQYI